MDYLDKYDENPYEDLKWNIPERKQGAMVVMGGNMQNFRVPIKIAEWISSNYPVEKLGVALPDSLKMKLPPLPDFIFLKSTDSGSLADADEITATLDAADYGLMIGDLSRNNVTARAVAKSCAEITRPLILTRDAVDLVIPEMKESTMMNENLVLIATVAQLQKLLRAIYYPRMLMVTQPLTQIIETLHKFTLSYPIKIVTLSNDKILAAQNGEVVAVPLEKSGYSPITLWGGELAAKVAAYNLYNPGNFLKATTCAIFA